MILDRDRSVMADGMFLRWEEGLKGPNEDAFRDILSVRPAAQPPSRCREIFVPGFLVSLHSQ